MEDRFLRYHVDTYVWHKVALEVALAVFLLLIVVFAEPTSAMRLQDRMLHIGSSVPDATTSYTVSFRYMSATPIGSVDLLFCDDPIPYHDCIPPAGLDVSQADLSEQLGEMGYSVTTRTTNHLVLSRTSQPITSSASSYTFDGIVNPSGTSHAFAVRLRTHTTTDATGPQVDFGSMRAQVTEGIVFETQVPPMLIFCMAGAVEENCSNTNEVYYSDMGELSSDSTLTAQSQMAVGTNATDGFVITANGAPLSAGTSVIKGLETPTESTQGVDQFGINLVANGLPVVGIDPEGDWANAIPTLDYGTADKYKFVSGDVVAQSPNVSLMRKFTVSYIVNSRPDLHAGVYSTTVTFVASGRF